MLPARQPAVSAALPAVLYHLTRPDRRSSILEHGLDWRRGDANYTLPGKPKANYLLEGFEAAALWRRSWGGVMGVPGIPDMPADVWEVDVSGLELVRDPEIENDRAWYVLEPVGPERLRLVEHGEFAGAEAKTPA